ncbi:insulinase family protein [Candidatus Fermentibacteria bacterium]|nr:insulinase family protein [Candidatus Fermentibacteria bacterium]
MLPCGIRLVSRQLEGIPVEGLAFFLVGGTSVLDTGTQGLESFSLECALMGSKLYPGPVWRALLDRTQAEWSGVYSYDCSAIRLTCLSRDLPELLHAFADCLLNPEMDSSAVEQVRTRLLQDLLRERSDPDSRVWLVANAGLLPGHPYSLRPDGIPSTIGAFTGEQASAFLESRMKSGNILVTHAGSMPAEDLAELLEDCFADIPPGRDEYLPPPVFPLRSDTLIVEDAPVLTAYAAAKFSAPPPDHPDFPLFAAAMDVLSDELWQVVRTDSALTYATYSGASLGRRGWGYIYVSSSRPERACPLLAEVAAGIADGDYDAAEAAGTLETAATAFSMMLSSREDQAYMMGLYAVATGDWRNLWLYRDIAADCDPSSLGEVLSRWRGPVAWGIVADTSLVNVGELEPWPLSN